MRALPWMVLVVVALRMDASAATAVLLTFTTAFVALYVVRPLRTRRREAAQLRLRSCRPYLPLLTMATAMKVVAMLSTLALHQQLAARRMLPRLPGDEVIVSPEFLAQPLGPVALFLAMAVLGPLIEEFTFRGRMQHTLEHAFGPVSAIATSAITFSVLHGRIDAVHHLAFGVFAGWVVWRTGSIWSAVYMHALNNALAQLMVHLTSDSAVPWNESVGAPWPLAIVGGLVGFGGLLAVGGRIQRLARSERAGFHGEANKHSLGVAISPAA
ncbi:MAG TPA: CPBP family intramembrane glutamic endopeptidase [Gemmatimonadaceae bacterium]|nr:CPBP family intramembrane glutamic endopeptidase [Gemmatimonadaceae bacterium]